MCQLSIGSSRWEHLLRLVDIQCKLKCEFEENMLRSACNDANLSVHAIEYQGSPPVLTELGLPMEVYRIQTKEWQSFRTKLDGQIALLDIERLSMTFASCLTQAA